MDNKPGCITNWIFTIYICIYIYISIGPIPLLLSQEPDKIPDSLQATVEVLQRPRVPTGMNSRDTLGAMVFPDSRIRFSCELSPKLVETWYQVWHEGPECQVYIVAAVELPPPPLLKEWFRMFPRTLPPSICLNGCCVFCFIEANQRIEAPAAWQVDWVLQGDFGWLLLGLGQGAACVCVWWTLASRIWLKSTRGQPYSDFSNWEQAIRSIRIGNKTVWICFLLGRKKWKGVAVCGVYQTGQADITWRADDAEDNSWRVDDSHNSVLNF